MIIESRTTAQTVDQILEAIAPVEKIVKGRAGRFEIDVVENDDYDDHVFFTVEMVTESGEDLDLSFKFFTVKHMHSRAFNEEMGAILLRQIRPHLELVLDINVHNGYYV